MEENPIDIGIIIPLQEEFEQFHLEIETYCRAVHDLPTGAYWYVFDRPRSDGHQYHCVATFVGDSGEIKAGLRTRRLLDTWQPKTVVVLGIAAGLSSDVVLGDVVAATIVDSYLQNSKAVDSTVEDQFTFESSGEPYRPSTDLINEVRHFQFAHKPTFDKWQRSAAEHLPCEVSEPQLSCLHDGKLVRARPQIKDGHVASGPTVAASQSFIEWTKSRRDRKFVALEMESGGALAAVYEAAEPARSLVLRGISDYGDNRKGQLDQIGCGVIRRYATRNAIHLLWGLIEVGALPSSSAALSAENRSSPHELAPNKVVLPPLDLERYRVAMQTWQLIHGLAQVPTDNVIQMNPIDFVSLLVSELPAQSFREMTFCVNIPPDAIFNFVYNYSSKNQFMMARIEGRADQNGRGHDNGRIVCTEWCRWFVSGRYTNDSEPIPTQRQHAMRVVLDPPGTFTLIVDNKQLTLEGGVDWEFDPQGKVGFLTEWKPVSVTDIEVQSR